MRLMIRMFHEGFLKYDYNFRTLRCRVVFLCHLAAYLLDLLAAKFMDEGKLMAGSNEDAFVNFVMFYEERCKDVGLTSALEAAKHEVRCCPR